MNKPTMIYCIGYYLVVLSRSAFLRGDDLDPDTDDEDFIAGKRDGSGEQCVPRQLELADQMSHEQLLARGMRKGRFVIEFHGERLTQRLCVSDLKRIDSCAQLLPALVRGQLPNQDVLRPGRQEIHAVRTRRSEMASRRSPGLDLPPRLISRRGRLVAQRGPHAVDRPGLDLERPRHGDDPSARSHRAGPARARPGDREPCVGSGHIVR